eukprot:TRINITY_DN3437_c0_g1_i1.p2 TRINITY_DN3437_c0_g1~~TRINITY_DN3437_c0_g1_i1.p2  ORF type:complete len:149 (+),score=12.44 TRINITY_DN3437_c0_g1_i1:230-676(+)
MNHCQIVQVQVLERSIQLPGYQRGICIFTVGVVDSEQSQALYAWMSVVLLQQAQYAVSDRLPMFRDLPEGALQGEESMRVDCRTAEHYVLFDQRVELNGVHSRGTTHFVRHSNFCQYRVNSCVTLWGCLLYTSPSPRDRTRSRMPSSA